MTGSASQQSQGTRTHYFADGASAGTAVASAPDNKSIMSNPSASRNDPLNDTLHPMPPSLPGDSLVAHPSPGDTLSGGVPEGPRLPKLPQVGLDEHVYSRLARKADEVGDRHAREAAKVGMYITLALNPKMPWRDKLRHFQHALNKHCHVETKADHKVWKFYHDMAHLVREHCGTEALRLASHEDDLYAARLSMGTPRIEIEREARHFFDSLIGPGKECPDYMLQDEHTLIRMIRDQWVYVCARRQIAREQRSTVMLRSLRRSI